MYFKLKPLILTMYSTRKFTSLCLISLSLLVAGCQPDDSDPFDEDNKPQPSAFTFKASFNGVSWTGSQNLSLLVKNSSSSPAKEMRVSANSADGKLLTLTLKDASTGVAGDGIAVRTYALGNGSSNAAFVHVNTNSGATYEGAYGSVIVTQSDATNKKVSGTFNCTLFRVQGDTMRITNGIFTDIPYDISEQ